MSWLSSWFRRSQPVLKVLSRPFIVEICGKVRHLIARETGNMHLAEMIANELGEYLEKKLS